MNRKSVVKTLYFTLLFIAVLCIAIGFSACKDSGENGENYENIGHDTGDWENKNGVYIGMVSDEDCPAGSIEDSKVKPDLEMQIGKEYYLIIDFTLQAQEDNDGSGHADVAIKIYPAATIDVTLHEAPSGAFTEEMIDDVRQIKIQFSIPEKAKDARDRRIVLRLKSIMGSEQIVDVSFTTDRPIAGNLTGNTIQKTTTSQYTQGLKYSATNNGGYSVSAGDAKDQSEIVIPYYKDGKCITGIDSNAFSDCSNLQQISIPNSVTTIGRETFSGCQRLTSVTIPDGVTTIGYGSFSGCGSLQYNEYDNALYLGNADNPYVVLVKAKSTDITSCEINESTKIIWISAFENCISLTNIAIPNGVTSIIASAFSGCSSLQYNEYDNALYLGNADNPYIFLVKAKSTDITSCEINESTKVICNSAFDNCISLTSVTIGNSVISIGNSAFNNCSSLPSITIPDSVTTMGDLVFYHCSSLSSVAIGNSVMSIGEWVFCGCSGLTSITIGNSVTSIGDMAFCDCSRLTSIIIPDSVTSIGYLAFYGCKGLTSVKIGNSVKSIGINAFSGCSNLQTVYWNATDCTISELANGASYLLFKDCSKLTQVVIGDNVTSIPGSAFQSCSGLTSVTIGKSVTSIGGYAFSKCSGLTNITLPNSVTIIENYAFEWCSKLTNVTIPDSVTSIGSSTFSNCSRLQYNEYDNALYLGNTANPYVVLVKAKSTGIDSCQVNKNTKLICGSAFKQCSCLTSITIPDSVTSIGYLAFYGCKSLTSVIIGNSVMSIGDSAFIGCSLTSVYYNGTEDDWRTIDTDRIYPFDSIVNGHFEVITWYYYSKTKPTDSGNYWHYVDGKVVVW